jgi:lysophospholipase L1-like esterase
LGTNDIVNGHSTNQFEEALRKIIDTIKTKSPDTYIYLFTLGYSNYHNNVENHYFYNEEARQYYNKLIINLCKEYKLGIIRIDQVITNNNYYIYLGDNLHYNSDGAKLINDLVCNELTK